MSSSCPIHSCRYNSKNKTSLIMRLLNPQHVTSCSCFKFQYQYILTNMNNETSKCTVTAAVAHGIVHQNRIYRALMCTIAATQRVSESTGLLQLSQSFDRCHVTRFLIDMDLLSTSEALFGPCYLCLLGSCLLAKDLQSDVEIFR